MKLRLLIIPALTAAALFAQGPGGFGGPRPGNPGMGNPGMGNAGPGGPGMMPGPQGPDGMGRGGMRPGGMRGRGRRMGMRGQGMEQREFGLARLLSDATLRVQLGVTVDQAAKIRQQESDFRKTEIRNRADLQIKRMDLNDLLTAGKPDRAAIDSKLQEVGAAQLAQEKSAIDYRLNMRDALTPAQRQKLEQMMAQRRQPMPAGAAPGGNAAPRGFQGGRAPAPPQGQAPPNR